MHPQDRYPSIAAIELTPIKARLVHQELGEGWSPAHADAVEGEYRRFLQLMKSFPQAQVAPSADVDIFWHYHILDTRKYAADCERVFGYFLHHCPSDELGGEAAILLHQLTGARMAALYEATFGEPYLRAGAPARTAALVPGAAKVAWCTPATPTAAWCTPLTPNAAWCTPAVPTAAWCTPSPATPAGTSRVALNDASYLSQDLAEVV